MVKNEIKSLNKGKSAAAHPGVLVIKFSTTFSKGNPNETRITIIQKKKEEEAGPG